MEHTHTRHSPQTQISTLTVWGLMVVIIEKMDTTTRVQILDKVVCISHSTNSLQKGMSPIILFPVMGR